MLVTVLYVPSLQPGALPCLLVNNSILVSQISIQNSSISQLHFSLATSNLIFRKLASIAQLNKRKRKSISQFLSSDDRKATLVLHSVIIVSPLWTSFMSKISDESAQHSGLFNQPDSSSLTLCHLSLESNVRYGNRKLQCQSKNKCSQALPNLRHQSDMTADLSATDTFSQTQTSELMTVTSGYTKHRSVDAPPSDADLQRGFRLVSRPNQRYLGFVPSRNDKRPYLNAMAVVGHVPDPQIFSFASPVSSAQVWILLCFSLLIALSAAASYFYIRSVTSSSSRDN